MSVMYVATLDILTEKGGLTPKQRGPSAKPSIWRLPGLATLQRPKRMSMSAGARSARKLPRSDPRPKRI